MTKIRIIPGEIPTKDLHQYIIASVSPRPIAFVSTKDEKGVQNLAPYSFFNAFSSNPPIVVFSSNRRVSDNTTKDTLHNVRVSGQCVINVVPYSIVRQMSLASVEFPSDESEFEKVGLTPEKSETVECDRVLESPINMECVVNEIIELGKHGGAGHLIICEVKLIAVDDTIMNGNRIDPHKLDLMGRMGRNYYVRASGDAIMEIYQSVTDIPIGFDRLPVQLKNSKVLTGNELCSMAALTEFPSSEKIAEIKSLYKDELKSNSETNIHQLASRLIAESKIEEALALFVE